jgi:hypothetical protein
MSLEPNGASLRALLELKRDCDCCAALAVGNKLQTSVLDFLQL